MRFSPRRIFGLRRQPGSWKQSSRNTCPRNERRLTAQVSSGRRTGIVFTSEVDMRKSVLLLVLFTVGLFLCAPAALAQGNVKSGPEAGTVRDPELEKDSLHNLE